jgi:hypothetical protein
MNRSINLPLTCFIILFTTLAIAGAGGMIVVTLRQQIAETAQHLQASEAETTRLDRLSEELRAKIAVLESPQALKLMAQKLGMQPAKLDQYRLMTDKTPAAKIAATPAKSTKAVAAKVSAKSAKTNVASK